MYRFETVIFHEDIVSGRACGRGQEEDSRPLVLLACVVGNGHGLNHRESLFRTVAEISVGLLAVESVEELPSRISQIEKRGARLRDEIVVATRRDVEALSDANTCCLLRGKQKKGEQNRGKASRACAST